VAAEAMHRLIVTPVCARGFAFAKDLELGTTVFLHCSHAPAKFKFEVGRKLVATVVQRSHGTHGAHIACEHWPRSTDTGRSSKNPVRLLVPLLEFNRVRLELRDDGAGFELNDQHDGLGLTGMHERVEQMNGELEITCARQRHKRRRRLASQPESML
jgi:hypothetical protein